MKSTDKYMLFSFMDAMVSTGSIDSRELITRAVQALSSQIPLNRHHAAGMLAELKRSGRKFDIVLAGKTTIVS